MVYCIYFNHIVIVEGVNRFEATITSLRVRPITIDTFFPVHIWDFPICLTLRWGFSNNEAACFFLQTFIFGQVWLFRTAIGQFGELSCVYDVALPSFRVSSIYPKFPVISGKAGLMMLNLRVVKLTWKCMKNASERGMVEDILWSTFSPEKTPLKSPSHSSEWVSSKFFWICFENYSETSMFSTLQHFSTLRYAKPP